MALPTQQDLDNLTLDITSYQEAVNGAAGKQVVTRLGQKIWTLATVNEKTTQGINSIAFQLAGVTDAANTAKTSINNTVASTTALLNQKLADLDKTINEAAAAKVGAAGWVDTLINVGNELNQRQLNDGIESIAALLDIENPRHGQRVYVKAYRTGTFIGGGWFIYDDTKQTINDGGCTLNGWVRQLEDFVTPAMFGAYADDTTDDSDAIQKAIDFCVLNKKVFKGQGKKYVVKRDVFTSDDMQDLLIIRGGIIMDGQGATIRIDQSNAPTASKIINLFKPLRPAGHETDYPYKLGKIEIFGFIFDGGFDYAKFKDHVTIADGKKAFFWYMFEVLVESVHIHKNTFTRFAQQNIIALGSSHLFKPYGFQHGFIVEKNYFYDNGLLADMSILFMNATDSIIIHNTFEQPEGKEHYVECAIELHADRSTVENNTFIRIKSWVNAAVGSFESSVGGYVIAHNTGSAIACAVRLWSGETPEDPGLTEINVSDNTVEFVDANNIDMTNIIRGVVTTGSFNKYLRNLNVTNNTANVVTLADTKPVYFLDFAVQVGWDANVHNVNVEGNTGTNMTGFARVGRYPGQGVTSCLYRNVTIKDNNLYCYNNNKYQLVLVDQLDSASVSIGTLKVSGNSFRSNYATIEYLLKTTGNIDMVEVSGNIYNGYNFSGKDIILGKAPEKTILNLNKLPSAYGYSYAGVVKVEKRSSEYLKVEIPVTAFTQNNNTADAFCFSMVAGHRIKSMRAKFNAGIPTDWDKTLTVQFRQNNSVLEDITNSFNILNKPTPAFLFNLTNEAAWKTVEDKAILCHLVASEASLLTLFKNTASSITLEVEIESYA